MTMLALAIPAYYGLLVVEWLASRRQGKRVYRFEDTFTNLTCGMIERALLALAIGGIYALYAAVQARWRLHDIPMDRLSSWIGLFLLIDLSYYWLHRLHHRVTLLWAAHSVHHQSEELNLSVGLRTAAFQSLLSFPFYLPIVLLGFPAPAFIVAHVAHNTYQLLVHTRLVGRLGPLERFLTTPSHHRVHHGRDPKYRDRNYSACLIVWDKLFGTFQREEEEPSYGTDRPPRGWSPVAAILDEWRHLAREAAALPRWRDRFALLWSPRLWSDAAVPPPPRAGGTGAEPASAPAATRGTRVLVAVEFLGLAAGALWLLEARLRLPAPLLPAMVAVLVWSLHALGVRLDGRRPPRAVEWLRHTALAGCVAAALLYGGAASAGSGG
jgi:sterol desaturase/sphingolipid hydroxylase (fatty acid hydroxylase superfamily)